MFECTATGVPGPTIAWRSNASSNFSEDSRVSLGVPTTPAPVSTPNGTIYSVTRQLSLTGTRESDSGVYYCEASSGEEDDLNVELSFELFVRGKVFEYGLYAVEMKTFEGENVFSGLCIV